MNYDLIGFSSGIYAFSMHRKIKKLIKKIGNGNGKRVFLISTSGDQMVRSITEGLERSLKRRISNLLENLIAREPTIPGCFLGKKGINANRPNSEDIEKTKEFARDIIEKL